MLSSIKAGAAPATLKKVTYRQLVKAATVMNQTVTATPWELAFGRRPADLIQLDVATPTQLTIDRNEEEMTAIQIKQLSKQAFQEARQSEDIRRDLAQNRSDGSKGGIWLKGKVTSIEGAMVGLDLGTRLIKVNMRKVRKDETILWGKPGIDLLLPEAPLPTPRRRKLPSQNPQCHYASREILTELVRIARIQDLSIRMHRNGNQLLHTIQIPYLGCLRIFNDEISSVLQLISRKGWIFPLRTQFQCACSGTDVRSSTNMFSAG